MANFRYILLLSVLLLTQLLKAQSVSISGSVVDIDTRQPIANVVVKLINTNYTTTTDGNGYFAIQSESVNVPTLFFSHVGYINKKLEFDDITKPLNIELKATTLNLNEVEILGLNNNQLPFSINRINLKKIEQTNLSDIGSIIAQEPNIGGIRKGATGIDPVVRGFKYSQVAVQLNGATRIEGGCPNRMDPTASHVSSNGLRNITIYKGPFALKYGANFGGLINLETVKPIFYSNFENHIRMIIGGQTNHSGYKSGIRVNGGNTVVSYLVSANRNKYGDYTAGNGDIIKASSDNYNVTAAIGVRPGDGQVVSLSFDRSWGRNVDFAALPMDERKDDTKVCELNYLATSFKNSINFIKFNAYFSDVNHEMDNKNRPFSDTVVAISKIHAINTGGRFATNINLLQGHLEIGGNYEHVLKDGNREKWLITQHGLPDFSEDIWSNATINNLGIFAEYQQSKNNLDWIISGRIDFNSAASDPMLRYKPNGSPVYENSDTKSDFFNFSISAGLTWHLDGSSELSIAFGKGTRSPDMTERFIILLPVGYDPYDYLGNPKLTPETNHELDIGYKFHNSRFGNFSTSIFFSYVTDYISTILVPPSEVKPQTKGVLGVKSFTNIDDAYLTGFELAYITPETNNWQIRFNTAYTVGINPQATVYINENGQVVDETTVKNDPLPEIPPLEANIWFNYKLFNQKLIPELNIRMVATQNMVSEAYNEETTPGFTIINFKLNYKYNDQLQVNMGINNLFNINYYEHLNRRIIGSSSPFLEPGRIFYANLIIKL